jgi:hypothetical protein
MWSVQEGHITRIASGCKSKDIDDITRVFEKEIESMVPGWMQQNCELDDDSMVILLDPDQVIMRTFTNNFTGSSEIWHLTEEYKKNKKKKDEYHKNGVPLQAPKT